MDDLTREIALAERIAALERDVASLTRELDALRLEIRALREQLSTITLRVGVAAVSILGAVMTQILLELIKR